MSNVETPRPDRRGPGNVRIEKARLVLAEGADEQGLVAGLLRHLGLDDFQIHDMGGKDTPWEKRIAAIRLDDGFDGLESLGLILDGDDNPAGAWQKCVHALERSGLTPPRREAEASEGRPHCSIYVTPGAGRPGASEELVLASVRGETVACAEQYLRCVGLPAEDERTSKRLFQVCAASFARNPRSIATLCRQGELDLDHEAFAPARAFVSGLAGVAAP